MRPLFLASLLLVPAACNHPPVAVPPAATAPTTYGTDEDHAFVIEVMHDLPSYMDGTIEADLEEPKIDIVLDDLNALDDTNPGFPDQVKKLRSDFMDLVHFDRMLAREYLL